MKMIREFCAENNTYLEKAIKAGVDRIELCDNLAVGGTTPSYGIIDQAAKLCQSTGVELSVMIRPRGGDFCYSEQELAAMRVDIAQANKLGATGIVFGCLTSAHQLDVRACQYLIDGISNMDLTFHMAFDQINPSEKYQALDQLIELGFDRILLHGNQSEKTVIENADEINHYIDYVADKLEIMVGGGITATNLQEVAKVVRTNTFHGTKIVSF
ncbi:copper homeostasis protein CutC [Amphibacillus cookii]|uniref:copper homeostasis protein CutC n=1 Tax=Amphibacillus cookii TaxID=767787 RepID=UPI00195A6632|nr:copper homeostasis protein CutC [Amphibacillus cookii]MBM7539897.1 copper homeostasis protein [Amphibacillus cookii]